MLKTMELKRCKVDRDGLKQFVSAVSSEIYADAVRTGRQDRLLLASRMQASGYLDELAGLMRALSEYSEIKALPFGGKLYLAARTREVVARSAADEGGSHRRYDDSLRGRFSLGEYVVAAPTSVLSHNAIREMHFIPLRDPQADCRHPHHRAHFSEFLSDGERSSRHPLEMSPSTCWSQWAGIAAGLARSMDIVAFLRVMVMFLKSIYPGSPLCRPSEKIMRRIDG